MLDISQLPENTLSDAIFAEYDDGCKEYRMDVIWHHLNQIKSPIGHNFSFDFLFRVAIIVLVIPHSNVGIERVSSMVSKNKNESSDRNRLDQDKTMSCILAVKFDRPKTTSNCCEFKPEKELIHKAKKATMEYNQEHSWKQD